MNKGKTMKQSTVGIMDLSSDSLQKAAALREQMDELESQSQDLRVKMEELAGQYRALFTGEIIRDEPKKRAKRVLSKEAIEGIRRGQAKRWAAVRKEAREKTKAKGIMVGAKRGRGRPPKVAPSGKVEAPTIALSAMSK
jgi:hypothetical protein